MLPSAKLRVGSIRAMLVLGVAVWGAGGLSTGTVSAEEEPTLQETLENGLSARRPAEIAFIGKVVTLVDKGRLPRSIVDSTYLWARQQNAVPFPYFEAGLRMRAKRIGISL